MSPCSEIWEVINVERDKRGISLYELARLAGVSDSMLTRWNQGTEPQIEPLDKVASALHMKFEIHIGKDRA